MTTNAPNQLSFLPEDYLIRKARQRTNLICATLFVVMISAIAIAFTTAERALASTEAQHTAVNQQYLDAAKRIAELQQLQQRQQILARQADLAASLIDRVPRSYLLAEITNRLPAGVSLRELEMVRKKRPTTPDKTTAPTGNKRPPKTDKNKPQILQLPPPPDLYDVSFRITGIAANDSQVAQFVTQLNESQLFMEVNLLLSAQLERTKDDLRKFSLEMQLNPSADIRPQVQPRNTQLTTVSP